ncbi:protease inhibitor I42 family protein [Kitasatospora sp. NPDC052868]|uniref:protease inhibitor I42 family protein n=1 Tax=Kitasatospora sp. NPDC052868 TaxID=3364060 RepID=UPI0037CA6F80
MTRRRILPTVAAVLVVVVAAGAVGVQLLTRGKLDHGRVFTAVSGQLTVKPGQLFSIEVGAYPTWGDTWHLAAPGPDAATVQTAGQEFVRNLGLVSGHYDNVLASGGHYYFVFRAGSPGQATITLRSRYGDDPHPSADKTPEMLGRSFTVDVRA